MRRSDRGSVTIWMLGLSMLLLLFGGLSLDYWRGLAMQRELASIADSAALAGASGIDEEHYRATGEVVLDVTRSRQLAMLSVDTQDVSPTSISVSVTPGSVSVTVENTVELLLLGVFIDDDEPLLVRGSATASPRLIP
ncbi:MAG: pilus assembly protein TadG-related protein [Actinomycetota bacterium]|nr:pilus assembly protein TadG-related protein [Actinomycetota bacterium]